MPQTAFGQAIACTQSSDTIIDKWDALTELTVAAKDFGLSHTTLGVLRVLLTFLPTRTISPQPMGAIVFPSNATLSTRLNGMPESTLRRHLGYLVNAGIVSRHDSGNRKRFARFTGQGTKIAFGFDLSPIARNHDAVLVAAETARSLAADIKACRCEVAHLRACLDTLGTHPTLSEEARRCLRRKLDLAALDALKQVLVDALQTSEVVGSDIENERHIQIDSKSFSDDEIVTSKPVSQKKDNAFVETLTVCKEFQSYFPSPVHSWRDLFEIAYRLTSMLGIDRQVFEQAVQRIGAIAASVSVLCILERLDQIKNPGGYLRKLAQSSSVSGFDILYLLRQTANCQLTIIKNVSNQ